MTAMEPESSHLGLSLKAAFRLAWRNLARSRRRTWITASTVALAVMLLQLVISVMIGLERQSFDNLIDYQTAHAKVFADGYYEEREEFPLDRVLDDPVRVQEAIAGVSGVAATSPLISFSAQLSDGSEQLPVTGIGIDLEGGDSEVFRLPEAVVAGRYLQPGEDELLLGVDLAGLFPVEVGEWLTVLVKTRQGAYEALDLPVTGLVATGNPLIDNTAVLVPLETAWRMLDMPGMVTEVAVRFRPSAREASTLTRLRRRLEEMPGMDVRSWKEIEENFIALTQMKRTGQTVFLSLFILMALVGITNTILMATFERTREIGALMAMGLRPAGVRRLFLAEGAMTGLAGGVLGSLMGLGIIIWLASVGIDFTAMFGDMDIGYPVNEAIYPAIKTLWILGVMAVTTLLATLAALYPAARASRLDPAEALRHV